MFLIIYDRYNSLKAITLTVRTKDDGGRREDLPIEEHYHAAQVCPPFGAR